MTRSTARRSIFDVEEQIGFNERYVRLSAEQTALKNTVFNVEKNLSLLANKFDVFADKFSASHQPKPILLIALAGFMLSVLVTTATVGWYVINLNNRIALGPLEGKIVGIQIQQISQEAIRNLDRSYQEKINALNWNFSHPGSVWPMNEYYPEIASKSISVHDKK